MRLLLDTNVLIWLLAKPERIETRVREMIVDADNDLFFSAISLLELASKVSAGKLEFGEDALAQTRALAQSLDVTHEHAWRVASLPTIHKDPFDRLLVAQALEENMILVTGDRLLAQYVPATVLT